MRRVMTIDINCDLGEINGNDITVNDDAIMSYITSANIACGFHAGDPLIIDMTIHSAIKYGVAIGAHPGYPDREGFGRRSMQLSKEELRASILYQVGALKSMTETSGGKLQHVKPHGALYNTASFDFDMAMVIARTVKEIDRSLILFGLAGSEMIRAAREIGLACASEVFADRAYNDDGSLVSRDLQGSILNDTSQVIERVIRMVTENIVESISGRLIPIQADTICLHGDNAMASEFAKSLVSSLTDKGIDMKSIGKR
jgi:UPF0271 protein